MHVGEPPPPHIPEAVPCGHVAMTRDGSTIVLVLAGPEGQTYRSDVSVHASGGTAAVRSVALAIEALRDAALDGPPAGALPTSTRRTFEHRGQVVMWTWVYLEREGGLFGPPRPRQLEARPAFYLGGVLGLGTERMNAMVGPRLGLAVCLSESCLALETDVPTLPQESASCDGRSVQYRPVTLGVRLSLRPFDIDDVLFFGFGFGFFGRFGIVHLPDRNRMSTDLGIRSGVEVAWRLTSAVELGFELGADAHVSPASFERAPEVALGAGCPLVETVLVEDLVTLWAALVLRVRP